MGKKKEKAAAKERAAAGVVSPPVPWPAVDADPLGFLIAGGEQQLTSESFVQQYWEQAPVLCKATPERQALVQGLCSLPSLLNWLRQRERKAGPLEFGIDVNAARYRRGQRETPNGDVADAATLQQLASQGCTLQVHQPQRWFDSCWRLLAALEKQFGCLVGSNAYLTPAGSQGLAPHWDDVELWVLQTSGSKAWSLYRPASGYLLPNQPSGDLEQSALGEPIMEVELSVGDVLYLPRGTVHQAKAQAQDSSHLTISTFQRCSYADLASHLLQTGLSVQEEPHCLPLAARRSPAPGTLLKHSLHSVLAPAAAGNPTPGAVKGLAEALRAIAAKLEETPEMVTAAVHSSAMDFLMNRLPPHPKQLPGRGRAPELEDSIWCRLAGWVYLLPFEISGMNCEDEDEGLEEGSVKLVSCLMNSREEHMLSVPDGDEDSSDEDGEEDSSEEGDSEGSDEEGDGSEQSEQPAGSSGAAAPAAAAAANGAAGVAGDGEAAESSGEAGQPAALDDHLQECCGGDARAPAGVQECCAGDARAPAGVQEHSLSSGAAERDNPVAALPGLVLAPGMVKAVVAFAGATSPDQAVAIKDLPLATNGQKLQLAFALWADGFAATLAAGQPAQGQPSGAKAGKKPKKHKKRAAGEAVAAAAAAGGHVGAAAAEQTGESLGKQRPSKKAKA